MLAQRFTCEFPLPPLALYRALLFIHEVSHMKHSALPGFRLNLLDPTVKYYAVLTVVGLAIWLFSRLLSSPFGAALEAIRQDPARSLEEAMIDALDAAEGAARFVRGN